MPLPGSTKGYAQRQLVGLCNGVIDPHAWVWKHAEHVLHQQPASMNPAFLRSPLWDSARMWSDVVIANQVKVIIAAVV